ncbi:MAG TPA: hypothetical protein VF092_18305 [Longimicrobium sp.]
MSENQGAIQTGAEPPRGENRREFLGTAAAAVAVTGVSTLLAACGESVTEPDRAATAAPAAPRASLRGGPDPGVTLHKMAVVTIGTATNVRVPALQRGVNTTYLQRVVTDNARTGTGLATVLKPFHRFRDETTVQVIVHDSAGNRWPPRRIGSNADLAYAMKDALATNPLVDGVLDTSLNAGSAVVALSKSSLVAFQDSVASDFYGNHLDIASRGFSDLFSATVAGINIASTTRDLNRC